MKLLENDSNRIIIKIRTNDLFALRIKLWVGRHFDFRKQGYIHDFI